MANEANQSTNAKQGLQNKLAELEQQKNNQELALKDKFSNIQENLKPKNIIKNAVKSAVTPATFVGLLTNAVTKKKAGSKWAPLVQLASNTAQNFLKTDKKNADQSSANTASSEQGSNANAQNKELQKKELRNAAIDAAINVGSGLLLGAIFPPAKGAGIAATLLKNGVRMVAADAANKNSDKIRAWATAIAANLAPEKNKQKILDSY